VWPNPSPRPLVGRFVTLIPVQVEHLEHLWNKAQNPDLWKWTLNDPYEDLDDFNANYFQPMLSEHLGGKCFAFTVVRNDDKTIIGSTRLFDFRPAVPALEIGYTWYAAEAQSTQVNPESKLLLLEFSFESLDCNRVQLKTDERNERSRRAMAKMGAQFEGVLRNYQTRDDGFCRNTAMFSVTRQEWPEVKALLNQRLVAFQQNQ
jgi:N-acetyltransferase